MYIILYLIDIDNLDNCVRTQKKKRNKSSELLGFHSPRFGVSNHLIVW